MTNPESVREKLEKVIEESKSPRGKLYGIDFEAGYHNGARFMLDEYVVPLVEAMKEVELCNSNAFKIDGLLKSQEIAQRTLKRLGLEE